MWPFRKRNSAKDEAIRELERIESEISELLDPIRKEDRRLVEEGFYRSDGNGRFPTMILRMHLLSLGLLLNEYTKALEAAGLDTSNRPLVQMAREAIRSGRMLINY